MCHMSKVTSLKGHAYLCNVTSGWKYHPTQLAEQNIHLHTTYYG